MGRPSLPNPRADGAIARLALGFALALIFACAASGGAQARGPDFVWSAPTAVAPLPETAISSYASTGVACPTSTFCVATDGRDGYVLISDDPDSEGPHWSVDDVGGGGETGGLSCPSSSFCALADTFGYVLTSTDPTAPTPSWSFHRVGNVALVSISCSSEQLCVAVASPNLVFDSTDPTSATPTWNESKQEGSVLSVSCASTSLCMLTGGDGEAEVSTNPTAASPTWEPMNLAVGYLNTALCVSGSLCLTSEIGGETYVTTNPTSFEWQPPVALVEEGDVIGFSCPTTDLCAAADDVGGISLTEQPARTDAEWERALVDPGRRLLGVSCPTEGLCFAVDERGYAVVGRRVRSLEVEHQGAGSGSVEGGGLSCSETCSTTYLDGTEVTLTATAVPGSEFAGWEGACAGVGQCVLAMTNDRTVSALFVPAATATAPLFPTDAAPPQARVAVAPALPLFATRIGLAGRTLGLLVGVPAIRGVQAGDRLSLSCRSGCTRRLRVSVLAGVHVDALRLTRPFVLRPSTVLELSVAHADRLTRFYEYRFRRYGRRVLAHVIASGCGDSSAAPIPCV